MKTLSKKNAWFIGLNYGIGYCFLYPVLLNLLAQALSIRDNDSAMLLLHSVFYITFLISMLYAGRALYKQAWIDLKERGFSILKVTLKNYGLALLAVFLINIVIFALTQRTESMNQSMLEEEFGMHAVLTVFLTIIFAPLVEELFFRGVIYNQLANRFNGFAGIIVSSVLFGLVHVIVALMQGNFGELLYAIPYAVMGGFIARSYYQSNSFAGALIFHCLQNTVATIFLVM